MNHERRIELLEHSSAKYQPTHILDQNEDQTYTVKTSPTLPAGAIITAEAKDRLPGLIIKVVRS